MKFSSLEYLEMLRAKEKSLPTLKFPEFFLSANKQDTVLLVNSFRNME